MTLYVQASGPRGAPTIVFLHGGGGAGWMWQPQVDALGEYHCLVPDLPEHGRSVKEEPFSIADSAARIIELIRTQASGGRAHIVGLSEGAQVAAAVLSQAPECAASAILSSALVRPLPGASLLTPGLIGLSFRWSAPPFKNNESWIRLNMKYAAGVPEAYYAQFSQTFRELTEAGFVHAMLENQRFRLPPGLERVTAPVLAVAGENEYAVMRQSARDLAAAIPGARACLVRHRPPLALAAAHNWNLAAPELFTRTVRAWVNGQPLPEELQPA